MTRPGAAPARRAAWPRSLVWLALAFTAAIAGGACRRGAREVVVYTSVDQPFSEPIFREFQKRSGIKVRAVFDTEETKSTGVLNRLIAEAPHPQADVFFSGDPVRPFLLAGRGMLERYVPATAAAVPAQYRSADGLWTGSAARAKILLVNTKRVPAADFPRSVRDLAAPTWKGRAAIANPLFGTTTMFVAALASQWGEPETRAFLEAVKANGARIASSNGEVKRLVASGEVAFGLTDTDDAHEALEEKAPVAVVHPDQQGIGTLVMPTSIVLLKGAPHPAEARALVDFLASADVEAMLAASAAHLPLRGDVPAPASLKGASSFRAMPVDYAKTAEAMARLEPWLRQWAGL